MDVVLIGAGGHGKVVLDILRQSRGLRPVGFLDADSALIGTEVAGLEVLGSIQHLPRLKREKVRGAIVSIGDNRTRRTQAREVESAGVELISAIHPSAIIASSARLGRHLVICARAVVCVDAEIGDSTILNTGCVVDHECRLGEAVHVGPGALLAGRVSVGDEAFVGMGSQVIQCLSVGAGATVGAGTTVIRDVPDHTRVVGSPARVISARA
jgi:UDP-perosamine 4-acetyltransferase